MKKQVIAATLTVLALVTAACGGGSGSSEGALTAKGPIDVWLSDNPEEIAWGKAMVKA